MNDPQVVALIYRVEHGSSVDYDEASPLSYDDDPKFHLTVEDNCARFELKEHYADVREARDAIEPFIQYWEFQTGIRLGPNRFSLLYTNAEIIDRNPSPSKPGTRKHRVGGHVLRNVIAEARVRIGHPCYPPPPERGTVDLDDLSVERMRHRHDRYRLGRTTLPDAANFCLTSLEKKYGGRSAAAQACGVSKKILDRIATLTSEKGGEVARKARGADHEFTDQERRFLREALKKIIIRAAQVAADDSQNIPQITMADLPSL